MSRKKQEELTFDKASDTLFHFLLTDLPAVITHEDSRNLMLNCNTMWLPGASLGVTRINWQGGFINTPSNDISFPTIQIIFLVDEHLNNWKTLYNWIMFMHNNKNKFAVAFDEPTVTGTLLYRNNWLNKTVVEVEYWKLWITELGSIQLTNKTDGSQYLEAQATFTFDRAEIKE